MNDCAFLLGTFLHISRAFITQALAFAAQYDNITDEKKNIIIKAKESLLFNGNTAWCKRETKSLFDVTMGSFDGAETCELVGLYLLSKLTPVVGNNQGRRSHGGSEGSCPPCLLPTGATGQHCPLFVRISMRGSCSIWLGAQGRQGRELKYRLQGFCSLQGVIFELMIVIGSRDSLLSIKVKKVNRTVSLH